MNVDALRTIGRKIAVKYSINQQRAEELAKDLIEQIEAHGGNPSKEQQTDSSIDVVVGKWLNP